jgi:RNA polymerase sigma-70 factor (ECF subfamily)
MLQTALDFFGRQDDAEDVTQDAMLQLWRYCEQIDGRRNVTGLAVRVAKNCCVNHHRRQRTEAGYEALKHSADEDYSPQQLLEADEAQRMIDEVLARLKPRERELFEMRRIEGLSTKQIAEQTGIPERSVSAMVSAARKKVFTELIKRMKQ